MLLYPLVFTPTFHYRIWGGDKLKQYGKNIEEDNIGESWEISTVPNFVSVVSNGKLKGKNLNELVKEYKHRLVGEKVYQKYGDEFPLLIKFLDSSTPLSVQVHPNDEYAKKHHNSLGKTEMWYVLDSEPDSEIILGFTEGITKEKFILSTKEGTVESILHKIHPEKEDVFYIPSGRVHALGAGLVVAEIQQTSDITYRIYDYNRIDKDGNKRELHIEQAKEVSDFSYIEKPVVEYDKKKEEVELVNSPYFVTTRFVLESNKKFENLKDSFRIFICTEGHAILHTSSGNLEVEKGQSVLIPAQVEDLEVHPKIKTVLLEAHIE